MGRNMCHLWTLLYTLKQAREQTVQVCICFKEESEERVLVRGLKELQEFVKNRRSATLVYGQVNCKKEIKFIMRIRLEYSRVLENLLSRDIPHGVFIRLNQKDSVNKVPGICQLCMKARKTKGRESCESCRNRFRSLNKPITQKKNHKPSYPFQPQTHKAV